jgi:iron-binding CDGSH zinc finger protein
MSRREAPRPLQQPQIRFYPDGPMLLRGAVSVVDQDGTQRGSRRKVIAVCLCGRSRMAPLCDGSHQPKRRPPPA